MNSNNATGSAVPAEKIAGARKSNEEKEELSFQDKDKIEEMTAEDVREFPISIEELTTFSNGVIEHFMGLHNLKINPRSAALTNVKNDHRHFCQVCVEKVTSSIIEGLEASNKKISTADATTAAVQFLRKINLRVTDNVSIEIFNKKGMEKAMKSDVFGGTPASVISCVQETTGTPGILKNTLGQEIFPGLLATGVVYDTEKQHAGDMLSDHSGITIGKLLEKSVEGGPCNCMWSEEGKKVFEDDCKNASRIISDTEEFEVSCNGIQNVFLEIDEDGIRFSDEVGTAAALVASPAPETKTKEKVEYQESGDEEGLKEEDERVVYCNSAEEESDYGSEEEIATASALVASIVSETKIEGKVEAQESDDTGGKKSEIKEQEDYCSNAASGNTYTEEESDYGSEEMAVSPAPKTEEKVKARESGDAGGLKTESEEKNDEDYYRSNADSGEALLVTKEKTDYGSEDEEDSDEDSCEPDVCDNVSDNKEEESDYSSEEENEPHSCVENQHFRPSYILQECIEDFRTTRLCLSLCKHLGCHIDSANKNNIFKCIVFLDKNDNITKNVIPQDDENAEESQALVKINDQEHMVDFDLNAQPSFSIGATIYELFAYEMNSGGEVFFDDAWVEHEKTVKAIEDDKRYDQAIIQGLGKDAAKASNAFCGHKFSKPCGKLYMAVNTTATPWPCVIRAPPVSEITRDTCYGSFMSFTIPLSSTFTGRNDSPSKQWRSTMYSNLALDKLEASFEPQTRRMIDTKIDTQWIFAPRVSDTAVKIIGSVINNHISGDKATRPTGLSYSPTSASALPCMNQFGVEARYEYARLLKLMSFIRTRLNKYMMETYKPEILAVLKSDKENEKLIKLCEIVVRYNNYISKLDSQLSNMSLLCTKYVKGFSE